MDPLPSLYCTAGGTNSLMSLREVGEKALEKYGGVQRRVSIIPTRVCDHQNEGRLLQAWKSLRNYMTQQNEFE